MANDGQKKHIKFSGYFNPYNYVYPKPGMGPGFDTVQRNRNIHGTNIRNQLQAIRQQFDLDNSVDLPAGIIRDDAIYVEFTSEWGYSLKFESLDQDQGNPSYKLLNVVEESRVHNDEVEHRYRVTVMMTAGGIGKFLGKVEKYLTENIFYKGVDTGNPKFYALLDNLQIIQKATLKSFWVDAPEIPFPEVDEDVWWEAWFRKTPENKIEQVLNNLEVYGVVIGLSQLEFAEHYVRLVKGTAEQLSESLLLLDNLAELRKPQEVADFITHKDATFTEQKEWLDDLLKRTEPQIDGNSILICLLDSGVNNVHPLITSFLPDNQLYSYNPESWGLYDSIPNGGHGTGVAGLALYGDLVDALSTPNQIQIFHGLESYKIYQHGVDNEPEQYGSITLEACAAPFTDRPDSQRVFCMTVTGKDFIFKGRPSAWSAKVDEIAFGTFLDPVSPQLFIVSGGNVEIKKHNEYPVKNTLESVQDPAQAYNAITVGCYTRKDKLDVLSGYTPLAKNGAMGPSNSTSMLWENQWPIKPDIVMEGGNYSTDGTDVSDHPDIKVLSTDSEYPKFTFIPFGDTSGAAALASKLVAELRTTYPDFWPETIRALVIHSADWTENMLGGRKVNDFLESEKRTLLRTVGYGVPIKERAINSANNSLTLIAEREIQPYKLEGSSAKPNKYHLFELPWPADILRTDLGNQDVTLKVTLSYYIEPNPGSINKRYATKFNYHSHELDFNVIKPNESLETFKRRVSAATELPEDEMNGAGEQWTIGRVRSRGSIKKDFITVSGADMAERNKIAVFPKNGWYRMRKKLGKTNSVVRYSLIVTIETPNTDVDIYTPVLLQIQIPIVV